MEKSDAELNEFFEIPRVVSWILEKKSKCVALQMADDVSPFALGAIRSLRQQLPDVEFNLLADSTLGK